MIARVMQVSIVLPAYDEVMNLERIVLEARAARARFAADGEILIVDDGSRDGTDALADALAFRHPNVRVVHHRENRGFSGAMATGFRESGADWVFLAPADGQTDLDELGRFLNAGSAADIVIGVRASRADGFHRTVLSRGFHLLARALFELPMREFSSVFLFRRALLDQMPFRSRPRSAALLPEILFRASRRSARFAELVVVQHPRRGGRAKGGQLSVAVLTLIELIRVAALARVDEHRASRVVAP